MFPSARTDPCPKSRLPIIRRPPFLFFRLHRSCTILSDMRKEKNRSKQRSGEPRLQEMSGSQCRHAKGIISQHRETARPRWYRMPEIRIRATTHLPRSAIFPAIRAFVHNIQQKPKTMGATTFTTNPTIESAYSSYSATLLFKAVVFPPDNSLSAIFFRRPENQDEES